MTTDYDDMTEGELQHAYEMRFKQTWPDTSLLLRRVLKLDGIARAAYDTLQGRPASDPPKETGVYLIHNGLGFRICEYFAGEDGDGAGAAWEDEIDDEIDVVRWWYLPEVQP